MIEFAVAVAGMCVIAGILLGIDAVRLKDRDLSRPGGSGALLPVTLWRQLTRRGLRLSRRTRVLLAGGVVVGVVLWLLTGWAVAVVIVPVVAAGAPLLLVLSDEGAAIERLEGMQDWTRSLAGALTIGSGIEKAIMSTRTSAPEAIRAEVEMLCDRLRARWTAASALRAFADDLDDNVGDRIVYVLRLGTQQRGEGLARTLGKLADSVARNVRMRRDIEAERSKTRSSARWITLIGLGVMLLLVVFRPSLVADYKTTVGQVLLLTMLAAYAGCLVWLRRAALGPKPPRLLGSPAMPGTVVKEGWWRRIGQVRREDAAA